MDLNELKGLSNEEAIKKAAEFAGVRPEILDGIWKTETGRGTHPTMIGPETKWGTAKGHFQQLDSIVSTWSQRTGKQLDPFNFTDGLYMAALHMRENVKRYGDEEQAVLAYHGGTNPKNWGPKTQDYLRKVAGVDTVKTPRASAKGTEFVSRGLPEGFAAQLADLGASTPAAVAPAPSAPVPTVQRDPLAGEYMPAAQEGDFRARVAQAADAADTPEPVHTWGEKQEAAYSNEMEPWFNIARQWQDGSPEKDLEWMRYAAANDTEVFKDFKDEGDREFLREAVSARDLEYRKARLAERKAAEGVTYADGFWSGLGHSVVAGMRNPVTATVDLLVGKGLATAARTGRLAMGAGRAARAAATVGLGAAEGAAGSIAVDGLLTMAGEYRSINDVTAGAIAGAGLGGLFSVPAYREASRQQIKDFETKALNAALDGKLVGLQRAVDELGPDADPAAIGRRAQQIEAQDMREGATAALSAAPEADRMPAAEVVPDELDADAASLVFRGESGGSANELGVEFWTPDEAVARAYAGATGTVRSGPAPAGRVVDLSGLSGTPRIEEVLGVLEKTAPEINWERALFNVKTNVDERLDSWALTRDPEVVAAMRRAGIDAVTFKQLDDKGQLYTTVAKLRNDADVADMPADTTSAALRAQTSEKMYAPYEDHVYLQRRKDAWTLNPDWQATARSRAPDLDQFGDGVHISQSASPEVRAAAADAVPFLQKYMPPGTRVVFGNLEQAQVGRADGIISSAGDTHVIGLATKPGAPGGMLHTALHEGGHAVFHQWAAEVPPRVIARINEDWKAQLLQIRKMDPDAVNTRFAPTSPNRLSNVGEALPRTEYVGSRDEYMAEQWVKHVQTEAAKGTYGDLTPTLVDKIVNAVKRAIQYVLDVTRQGKLRPDEGPQEFFSWILEQSQKSRTQAEEFLAPDLRLPEMNAEAMPVGGFKGPAMLSPEKPRITGADWDFARKYGLDLMPQNTPMERAEFKAVLGLYRKAEAWVAANPRLDERAQTLLNKSAMFQVTGTALASSDNPVARMVAGTLLESTTGAQGRRNTAAIAADMHNRRFLGNSVHAYTSTYEQWRKLHDGSVFDDVFKGTMRERFDRAVAMEIEGRRTGVKTNDPLVARAADHLEVAYERMRSAQVSTGTVGFAMLPDSAKGYMPHALNKAKVNAMTPDELRTFVDIMTEQFQSIEGFDAKFSAELARKYVDHARVNANGGHEIPANIHQPGAADMVRKALEDVGVGREELVEMMQRFSRGGPGYTKQRLHLDLNREYPNGVKLLDLYDTNQLELLRRYSRRVSGEVALAQHGVMGSQGLRLLRRAMEFGPDADKPELRQAFDQVASEFLGQPFGNQTGKWMDRAMQANGLARLGGMGFTQAGEMVNAVAHIGVLQSLDTIPALPRLRREVHAIARGEKVENGILNSIEQYGGAGEFGVDGYRMVLPYDDPNAAYHSYGKDTVQAVDKVLRAGNYAQGIMSGWRMIHAVQQRAVAEQITLKAIRYVRDGLESVALEDMGFTKSFQAKLRKDLPNMVQYDASGKVKVFDLTKATDPDVAATFAQSVLRGTNQIIQGQFIGETGKWAHDGWLKMFTQFRTFPLVAMEKQWARQRHNHGMLSALGLLAGSMAAVSPIIMLRVAMASVGRPDQDEYLEEKLQPANIARMALNYVAMAGLAGDLVDALSAVAPDGLLGEETGARSGGSRGAVGNLFAPSLGYVDDAYKALQDAGNPHKWAQLAPLSRVPPFLMILNTLRDED